MKYPLSQSQLGIYYACQHLEENGGNYQIPVLYPLPDNIDLQRLRVAINVFLKAHPYLFSHLVVEEGEPMMETGEFHEIEILEVRNLNEVRASFMKVMDLTKDPLFRLEIYKTEEGNFFFMDFHHIIYDGSSGMVFGDELNRAYKGEELVPELMNGGEVAAKEAQERKTSAWKSQREWFLNAFSNAEEVDSKPIHISELQKNGAKGLCETNYILPVKEALVKGLCQRFGVKKSTIFTAVWGKLMANYTAEDRASFCTIHHGRVYTEAQRTLTMMVRTLPVYMEMSSDKSVLTWLQEVENQQETLRENYLYSFSDAYQDMNLQSDILFAYHGAVLAPASDFSLTLGEVELKGKDLRVARPGLALDGQLFATALVREDSDFTLRISYDTSLYSAELIAEMVDAYAAILNSMPDAQCIADLKAVSVSQLEWLNQCNPEFVEKQHVWKPILYQFAEQVKTHPDHICCVFQSKQFTYAQVNQLTDTLAARIQQHLKVDSHKELPVASFICPRNEMMLIFPLAIVKAGCTYQPLDASYPQDRLNFMINDAQSQVLLCTSEYASLLTEFQGETLIVNTTEELHEIQHPAPAIFKSDDTFILLYTSGTTGTPKGVQITHRNVDAFLQHHTNSLKINNDSRLTAYASYGFDAYVMDLWGTLTTGASLHIISEEIRYDLVALKAYLEQQQITHAFMTTQVGTQMAINFPAIPSLQALMVGGEKLVSIDPPHYRFINGYGPTETLAYVASEDVCKNETNIPIGKPNVTTRLYILNKDAQRVPMGAAGELWIAGPQVSKGYLRQPEKTAMSFIPNPFVNEADRAYFPTIYRTGDIVRYREDGKIEFVGRKDGQVKIRGFRIELKEVEAVIRDFPGMKEVTVQAFDLEAGGKALAAYFTANESVDTSKLEQFIKEQKPPYMVPAAMMQLDEIPVNVNGKVDKKRLPKPEVQPADSQEQQVMAPLNDLENELKEMIVPLVNCSTFSITTPLSHLGLTSITSIKLYTQIYKRFGVNIKSNDVHDASLQTLENLILQHWLKKDAEVLVPEQAPDASVREHDMLSSNKPQTHFPLSNAQLGIYFECLKQPESTVYNIPNIIYFPEQVAPEKLQSVVKQVIAAHPMLSARFSHEATPLQWCESSQPLVTLSNSTVKKLKANFVQPFDLENGPLYRAVIAEHALLFDVHHLVMDGSSMTILVRQLCDILNGKALEAEDCPYFTFVNSEQKADVSAAEAFFHAQLEGIEEMSSIPADLHGNEQEGRLAEVAQPFNHTIVESYARKHGVTPAAVYLAALSYVTARYCNSSDVSLCTISSGRSNLSIADTVGMFVNTLALTTHLAPQSTHTYIKDIAANFAKTLEYENYPFARIAEKYDIKPELAFVYQLGVMDTFEVGGVPITMEQMELTAPKFRFALIVEEREGIVNLVAEYNNALYSADAVQRLLSSLQCVITQFVAESETPLLKVTLPSAIQQRELDIIRYGGFFEKEFTCFHEGITRWAQRTPEALAIISCGEKLTYKNFDLRANRIANALLKRGLRKGNPVIVLLPRTSSVPCCVLGIMKAGGAFIACDPEYPTERIQLIADDSAAPFVITTSALVSNYGKRGIDIEELLQECDETAPDVVVQPSDLAYMIYTSGSTGKPKGVRVLHSNITTLMNVAPVVPMGVVTYGCSRVCSVFTISFDAFICDFGMALCYGHTFIFANETESKDPIALAQLMEKTHVDYMSSTSSRMLQYIELPAFMDALQHCKVFLQGGEKFSDTLLHRLQQECPHLALLNGYGPTEISICCNMSNLQNSTVISVGHPNPNYTEWVLDKDGNELPVGVTGELCVGGDGVTQGYNNLPELTQSKFITYGGMRAFKTGDFARWLTSGEIEILGRTDNQVKLRGLRIELGEVESALSKVEGMKNVLVKICNINGRDHLAAYFVADKPLEINAIKQQISRTLTAYMVPSAYLQLDAFPITPNGKIDFRHLPEPLLVQSSADFVAPQNAAEQFFASTFAEVLELERVGATDNFFDLGGTSLVVMRVVIMAQKANYTISYADVFANPTPRQLAKMVNASTDEQTDSDDDLRQYDYADINRVLQYNSLESFQQHNERRPLGNVLLTGATGFLGIHIFRCLVEQYPDVQIHCLLRSKDGVRAENRLSQLYYYYFEKHIHDLFGQRVFVHEGDVTAPIHIDAHIGTVINCAAIVKHFAKGTEIDDVNVGGVKNCIDYCLRTKARLIQVSTYSVAGMALNGEPQFTSYSEQMLYEGQYIRNQYVHSKLLGERLLLQAVATQHLDAKIMRVGNLSARSSDGEFQINSKTNSFMGRLRVFQMLGAFPYSAYESPVEFSPIDEVSAAICLLSQTSSYCTVFHPYNTHTQMLGDVLHQFGSIGKDVQLIEDTAFVDIINAAKADASRQETLAALLAYEGKEGTQIRRVIPAENHFTHHVLLRLGFTWSPTSWDYVNQFLRQINTLEFFE